MKFEEQFKSLHGQVVYGLGENNDIPGLPLDVIQDCCLGKQRVKDAIDKTIMSLLSRELLLKELGLED